MKTSKTSIENFTTTEINFQIRLLSKYWLCVPKIWCTRIRPPNNSWLSGSLSQSNNIFCKSAGFFDTVIRIRDVALAFLWENVAQFFSIELFSWQKFHKNICMRYKSWDIKTKVCKCKQFQFETKVRDFCKIISAS